MPWRFGDYLVEFQALSSGLLGPIIGIMIADYYIIRKRELDVEDLYEEGGRYFYRNGYNPAAILALAISFGGAIAFIEYAFFIGFSLAVFLYVALSNWTKLIHSAV